MSSSTIVMKIFVPKMVNRVDAADGLLWVSQRLLRICVTGRTRKRRTLHTTTTTPTAVDNNNAPRDLLQSNNHPNEKIKTNQGTNANDNTDSHHHHQQNVDYLTNNGIVVGVWMFSRHGDRTPSKPLSPEHRRNEEAAFWVTKLPIPDTVTLYEKFSHHYPLVVHPPPIIPPDIRCSMSDPAYILIDNYKGTFIDAARNPFGFLTDLGVQQLCDKGRKYFNRYNQLGYHFPNNNDWRWDHARQDFLSVWNIQVYSTNYLRTIMSVQSFLDGMLGTNCYDINDNNSNTEKQQSSPNITIPNKRQKSFTRQYDPDICKEERMPTHTWPTKAIVANFFEGKPTNQQLHGGKHLVPIQVRNINNDPLNAFDRNPDLIAELVSEVMLSEKFLVRDSYAAPVAARLANILPGLVRHKHRKNPIILQMPRNTSNGHNSSEEQPQDINTSKNNDFATRTPSGINWVEAADHFVCRGAHNLSLAQFTDYEHEQHIEQTLQAMSHQTIAHLSWRFRQWYQHPKLLAAIAAPPLREIFNQMKCTPELGIHEQRPFVIYSCHDITILGLLYGIGAEFLADDDSSEWRYWPPYGCNLIFELVRIPAKKEEVGGSSLRPQDSHVVRILLNGKPVVTVDLNRTNQEKRSYYTGTGPHRMLLITDFEEILTKLEKAGGHDYAALLGQR